MRKPSVLAGAAGLLCLTGALRFFAAGVSDAESVVPPPVALQTPGGGTIEAVAVGHSYRQDDCPSIAVAPDGAVWAAWLSFAGQRDDVALRRYQDGHWGTLQWVPATSGDSWQPQVFADAASRVWVVWSMQVDGNWDLYARRFDPRSQQWNPAERLTTDPLPDINPRLAASANGRAVVAWQGFRGRHSNIFLRVFDGERWTGETRVTNQAANDWEPAAALDARGDAWVVFDSYRNGNYDVFLTRVAGGRTAGAPIPVASTPLLEARATVAVDAAGHVWVAWEEGSANWGKDQGYIIRDRQRGAMLGGNRQVRVRRYAGGQWQQPAAPLPESFRAGYSHQPHIYADAQGSVWLAAKLRRTAQGTPPAPPPPPDGYEPLGQRGFWEYWVTHLDGAAWSEPFPLPSSRGRTSTRLHAALDAAGRLWTAWPTDNRTPDNPHRPLRGQVYAASLAAPAAGQPALREAVAETVTAPPVHPNESADVEAIRRHAVTIAGTPRRILRGDVHRHTELSWDISGTTDGSLQDFYRYMIDAASMDFGASTDHQGGAWEYWWWYTLKMTDMHYVPGAYTAFHGYERSTQFPFGHRNMLFGSRAEAKVTPFFLKPGSPGFGLPAGAQGDEPPVGTNSVADNDTLLLHEELRGRNVVAIPHTSGNRMGTNWRFYDPELDPVVEIFQGCRTSYEQVGAPYVATAGRDDAEMKIDGYQEEGMVANAWAKGHRLGIIASSDHFSTHISFAMVYAESPSRQAILDGLRRRHTYGATDNIILEAWMGAHFMGDRFAAAKALPLRVKARGTGDVARVDVLKDGRVVYSVEPRQRDVSFAFTDTAAPAGKHHYYVRLLQADGMIAWSSPFFVNW